jgi:aspartate/methionine/tyrosine aminotransferase
MNELKQSTYMNWAKTRSFARFSLATSGVMDYPLKDLGVDINDLEISGPTYYGYVPLQEALAGKCGANKESVMASIGTSMANHLVLATLLEPGDEILVEEPTYEPLLAVAKYLKANIRRFPRNSSEGFQIDPERLVKLVTSKTKLIVVTNFHNPSGVYTDPVTMKAISEIAQAVGARVLVDEVYLECLFPKSGDRISSFHLGNHFIVTSSLTKAYGLSGLRCGWILAEPDFIERMKRINDLFASTPSHTSELLSVIALQKLSGIAERSKALLKTNRKLLNDFFDQQKDSLEVVLTQYGTIAFPRLKKQEPEEFFTVLREKYETLVVPGKFFEMPEYFRIGIGGPTETLVEGLSRLGKALE